MESSTKPAHVEIEIDEWLAAMERVGAVHVRIVWRDIRDPNLAAVVSGLPSSTIRTPGFSVGLNLRQLVPIQLHDGRTELAPREWKGLRFGKGPSIYELARADFETWSAGNSFLGAARDSEIGRMVRRHVPNFEDYTEREQWDFLIRTQEKIDAVRDSLADLSQHLDFARPDTARASTPRKELELKVKVALFSDVLKHSRRTGELLGVPQRDKTKYENQRVRQMAKVGRPLLHEYYGKSEYDVMINRMQRYHRWWKWYSSIDNPREQMYVLIAEVEGTHPDHEESRAAEDGFADKLEEWVSVVERRLSLLETHTQSGRTDKKQNAQSAADQLWLQQQIIEQTDSRFKKALSLASLEAPPPSIA